MFKKPLMLSLFLVLLTACGGGGSDTTSSSEANNNSTVSQGQAPSIFFDSPVMNKAQSFNVKNIVSDLGRLSNSKLPDVYKKIHTLQLSGFPDIKNTFNPNDAASRKLRKSASSRGGLNHERHKYSCRDAGTVTRSLFRAPRHGDADTYKDTDETSYVFSSCDNGTVVYNRTVTYAVHKFSKFDFTFGAIPLGKFVSSFDYLSMATETQIVTLNGVIEFEANANYSHGPDDILLSLETRYTTVGDFVVTVYDKRTRVKTKLAFNGILEKIEYQRKNILDVGFNFTYQKTSDYSIAFQEGDKKSKIKIKDSQSGDVGTNGEMLVGNNNKFVIETENALIQVTLIDGTLIYNLENIPPSGGSSSSPHFYAYETGKIIYSTEGQTVVTGFATIDYTGTKTFIFKDWGKIRIYKEETEQVITNSDLLVSAGMPRTEYKTVQKFEKFDGPMVYAVDYEKEIIEVDDYSVFYNLLLSNPDAVAGSLTGLTGEVTHSGDETVLGYNCENYTSAQLGVTTCLHKKNIELKSVMNNSLGSNKDMAISAEFNIEIPESEFALPNYPHQQN